MKISLNVLNVGQGDSFVLEWPSEKDSANNKFGIVDCNKYQGRVPTIDFIKSKKVAEIEYAIISHPHSDHFSGYESLLEYLDSKNIKVKYFFFTFQVAKNYLYKSLRSHSRRYELSNLLFKIDSLKRKGVIGKVVKLNDLNKLPIWDDTEISVISPSDKEDDKFINQEYSDKNVSLGNIPAANFLSTVLKIGNSKNYLLLTSDAEKFTFKRITSESLINPEETILLGQIAHHGSNGNLERRFWKKIYKNTNTRHSFVSVGSNIYGHPSEKVVKFFTQNHVKIHSTNEVGRLSTLKADSPASKIKSLALDRFTNPKSTLRKKRKIEGWLFNLDFKNGSIRLSLI